MSRRLEWWLVAALLIGLVVVRAWPFLAWTGVHFDSDQAIVGLMAKHISEGRAFPLFFYGQTYMLAVEAWLAAPVMAVAGATVAALKLPLVVINIAVVLLVTHLASRDLVERVSERPWTDQPGLRPALAGVVALPLALPPAGVATRVVEANGGNVEPWLYVLLLWMLRRRPWAFGVLLGVAALHREFSLYGALAIIALDLASGRIWSRDRVSFWTVAAIAALAVRTTVSALLPFSSIFGPGTSAAGAWPTPSNSGAVGARLCFAPEQWSDRIQAIASTHLPLLYGGTERPLAHFGVHTDVIAGHAWVTTLVAALVVSGIVIGAWVIVRGRGQCRTPPPSTRQEFAWYLLLVGAASIAAYALANCNQIDIFTLRYDLLAMMVPVGAVALLLSAPVHTIAKATIALAIVAWTAANLGDVNGVTWQYRHAEPADIRHIAADVLVARRVPAAWAEFRIAYHISFLAQERIKVASSDVGRIHEYAEAARAPGTPTISAVACAKGQEIAIGVYLCPP